MGAVLRCIAFTYPIASSGLVCLHFAVTGSLAEVSRADPFLDSHLLPRHVARQTTQARVCVQAAKGLRTPSKCSTTAA